MAEDDLIIGDQKPEESASDDFLIEQAEIRQNIDTAVFVYEFLDELDLESPDVLKWRLTNKLKKTKRSALELIIDSMQLLQYTEPDEGDDK